MKNQMIRALRKCADEHEKDIRYTGHIVTSHLCRDVADYLEADPWHYPSKGELPTESGEYLVLVRGLNGKPRPHVFEYYLQDG